jgi:hypothetical protein
MKSLLIENLFWIFLVLNIPIQMWDTSYTFLDGYVRFHISSIPEFRIPSPAIWRDILWKSIDSEILKFFTLE